MYSRRGRPHLSQCAITSARVEIGGDTISSLHESLILFKDGEHDENG